MTGYSSLILWQPIFTPILTLAFGLITFFSFFGCGKPKIVLICGDHVCVNKSEAEQYFEKNL